VADTVRVGLDRFVLDTLGREELEERVEPNDGEGDAPRACPRRVRLDEERGVLVDLSERFVPYAEVWRSAAFTTCIGPSSTCLNRVLVCAG
jgi:hypothetical protein